MLLTQNTDEVVYYHYNRFLREIFKLFTQSTKINSCGLKLNVCMCVYVCVCVSEREGERPGCV